MATDDFPPDDADDVTEKAETSEESEVFEAESSVPVKKASERKDPITFPRLPRNRAV